MCMLILIIYILLLLNQGIVRLHKDGFKQSLVKFGSKNLPIGLCYFPPELHNYFTPHLMKLKAVSLSPQEMEQGLYLHIKYMEALKHKGNLHFYVLTYSM